MRLLFSFFPFSWFAANCFGQTRSASDEEEIRKADAKWSESAKIGTLETILSFYADDACVLPFNAPLAQGKSSIRQLFTNMFSKPGWSVAFGPTKIELAKSGDLAYEVGTARITFNDPEGHPITIPAKYVVAWRKDSNHEWKAVADIFNTDK